LRYHNHFFKGKLAAHAADRERTGRFKRRHSPSPLGARRADHDRSQAGRIIFTMMLQSKVNIVRRERVDESTAGQRIDNYLLRVAKGVPKSHIYRILRGGEVRVNGRRVSQVYRLTIGDEVRIPPLRLAESTVSLPRCVS
jgi:ribosomal 50S subunit-recycling heat shock protein